MYLSGLFFDSIYSGSCVSAGYSGCCRIGACRGRDVSTGELASCTCDEFCREMGTCCYDVAESCPSGTLDRERRDSVYEMGGRE